MPPFRGGVLKTWPWPYRIEGLAKDWGFDVPEGATITGVELADGISTVGYHMDYRISDVVREDEADSHPTPSEVAERATNRLWDAYLKAIVAPEGAKV